MAELGGPVYYELCDVVKYVDMRRALFTKQLDLAQQSGISLPTLRRLEREPEHQVEPETAKNIHRAFDERAREGGNQPISFDALFKAAVARAKMKSYGWRRIVRAAEKIGKEAFVEQFSPDAVITFAGPSALFANLCMVRTLPENKMLSMPVFLAQQRRWKRSSPDQSLPQLPGFTAYEGEGVMVLMPGALVEFADADPERKKKFLVLDDSITSGVIPPVVRDYFEHTLRYPRENVRIACGVYYDVVLPRRKPDFYAIPAKSKHFLMPWGKNLYFGEEESDVI